jgi:hypothetical protein
MKIFNTKDIRRSLDEEIYAEQQNDILETLFNVEESGPCRHVSIRPENDRITLYLNKKEIMSQSIKMIGREISMKTINEILGFWRNDEMGELKKYLRIK